ncbi:MAG: hypothetical protein K2X91_14755, partial [Thermoleophilia bacterium]|nr:hypothetical protein [Thermoleophilia bacterium]
KYAFAPKDRPPDGNDFERELETGALNICRRDLIRNAWIDKTRAALGPGPARFVEGGFLGQGWCLYPAGKLLPLVRYEAQPPLLIASGSPDGRLWTVEPGAGGRDFGPRPFVKGAARAVLARLEKGDIRPAIPPGTGVRVVVNATSDGLKRSLAHAAGTSLVHSGLKPDETGGFTLMIDAKEVATGLSVPYVQPGVGSENAAHRTIELRATLTDKAGKAVFYAETVANPPRTLTFQRGKASEALAAEVQASAASWAGRLSIPPTKHFIDGELKDLPLVVPFTGK